MLVNISYIKQIFNIGMIKCFINLAHIILNSLSLVNIWYIDTFMFPRIYIYI